MIFLHAFRRVISFSIQSPIDVRLMTYSVVVMDSYNFCFWCLDSVSNPSNLVCRACNDSTLCGPPLPRDPFERACEAVYRSTEPFSIQISVDCVSGHRTVSEVVPHPWHNLPLFWTAMDICRLADAGTFRNLRASRALDPARLPLGPGLYRRALIGDRPSGGRGRTSLATLRRALDRMRYPGRSRNE